MRQSREESPILVKHAGLLVGEPEGPKTIMYWMKAKTTERYPAAFQKVSLFSLPLTVHSFTSSASSRTSLICTCIQPEHFAVPTSSDFCSLSAAANISGLKRHITDGPSALGMMVRNKPIYQYTLHVAQHIFLVKSVSLPDVLQVRNHITPCNLIAPTLVRNDFDCGDWLLYTVSSTTTKFPCLWCRI
jgi:hypothetical protein